MATQAFLGNKIRRLRKEKALTQVQLAQMLSISASYLNLIERNQRAMTVPLLLKLAELFNLDLRAFAEDDEAQLVADLKEAFADSVFSGEELRPIDAQELGMGSPQIARAVLRLYRAYRKSREDAQHLATSGAGAETAYGHEALRLPVEEVSDVIQDNMNFFPDLEAAAETLAKEAGLDLVDLHSGLLRHLEERHHIKVEVVPADQLAGAVRRYLPKRSRLLLSEVLSPATQTFQLAHQIGLLTLGSTFTRIVDSSPLTTDDSRRLGRVALSNYFAACVLMPYDRFLDAAETLRYDLELLEHRFRTSYEQVCHRLTSMNRTGAKGVPFHLIRIDIAGNISKRFSGSGIPFARYSGACPRWNVHAAFLTPGMIRTQLSSMPDGTLYFSVARTVRKAGGGYHMPQNRLAIELGCEAKHAHRLVYADGIELERVEAAVPVGVTCRLCERIDCRQRAFPPMHHRLAIDENVRGYSFFTPPQGK